jgi:hypothetical protein
VNKNHLIYLASPHQHNNRFIEHLREQEVLRYAAWMTAQGLLVYCPIAYGRALWSVMEYPLGWEFWAALDSKLVAGSDEVRVMCMPGWECSTGVTAEIRLAKELGRQVTYATPSGVEDEPPDMITHQEWMGFWARIGGASARAPKKQLLMD